jgi:tRNA U34 5-methylaminomethyl-2-thiouridine-forming methyltransferase MnmC
VLEAHHLEPHSTADGSMTLRHLSLDVLYRSNGGAKGEAEHVFVDGTGLADRKGAWRVLELGFGTGLNFLVTAAHAQRLGCSLDYVAVEAEPIPPEFVPTGYPQTALAQQLLSACRESKQPMTMRDERISLSLHPQRWQEAELTLEPAHAVFHDPFDPTINPDCWTVAAFRWSRCRITLTGRLATYSAAGHMRRAMRDAGYVVARCEGFGQKREMTLASPTESALAPQRIKYRP